MYTSRPLFSFAALLLFFFSCAGLFAQRPVAWYPLDGNAQDAGGNGYHGVLNGALPAADRFGNPGGALAFTAAERDHVIIRSYPALSFGTHDFTVAAWVKFCGSQPEYAGIVCKGPPNNSYPGYQLHIASGDKFTTQIGDDRNGSDERRGTTSLGDGRWHLVAVAVSPRRNLIEQYVDGQLVTSRTQVYTRRGNLNVSRFDPTFLYIGTERNFSRFFDGTIDDVRLFDRTLSAREMMSLYRENGWTGEDGGAAGPVAWYPFNGNAEDASGNGLNGIVHGAAPTFDRFGNCNSAYAFNGAEGDYIAVRHNPLLAFGRRNFTVAAWVKFCGSQPEYAGIVCKGPPNNSYPGYQLHIASRDKFTTQIGDNENWSDERRGKEALNDGEWHHVAVMVSPGNNTITQYVDGQPVASWTQIYTQRGNLNVSRFDPTPLLIGTERNFSRFFTGIIDDVRLYDRELSRCEMEALYHENGWTGESRLPEPEITVTGPTAIRTWERTRLSIDCYPDVRWSTGETGPEITADRPGIYSAVVSDGSGCNVRSVTIRIDDAFFNDSLLLSLDLPGRCMGSTEQIYVKLPNPSKGWFAILAVYSVEGEEFVEFNTRLPIYSLPGEEAELGFVYRWFTAGAQKTTVNILTTGGHYRIELTSTGQPAYGPVFDRSRLAIEGYIDSNAAPFCVPVTNISGLNVTITSASWAASRAGFELVSPTIPFRVRPGETVQLCFRYLYPALATADNVLVLGGEGMDRYGEYSECVAHRFRVHAGNEHDPVTGEERDLVPVTGSDNVGNISGVEEGETASSAEGILEVRPNPVQNETSATFVMARPGDARLELFDARGRKVRTVFRQGLAAGTQLIRFDVEDLPSGLYMLRLSSEEGIRTAPVVVRR